MTLDKRPDASKSASTGSLGPGGCGANSGGFDVSGEGGTSCPSASGLGGSNVSLNEDHRRQNHCEIEKRRRDKMNHYIMQLASVIPSFNNNQSKLDKLTVLRMAVQHVKSLRSSLCSFSSFHLRPSFLSSGDLLKNLILQMASHEAQDNLVMVVTCDRGKILFVSPSSKDILNHEQNELVGQSLFDILHKDDVSKVKEQISYFSLMPREMLVDSKTLQPIKQNQKQSFLQLQNQTNSTPQPGARRSFFCRMKIGRIQPTPLNEHQLPSSASLSSSCNNIAQNHRSNQSQSFADSLTSTNQQQQQRQHLAGKENDRHIMGDQKQQQDNQLASHHQQSRTRQQTKSTSSQENKSTSYTRSDGTDRLMFSAANEKSSNPSDNCNETSPGIIVNALNQDDDNKISSDDSKKMTSSSSLTLETDRFDNNGSSSENGSSSGNSSSNETLPNSTSSDKSNASTGNSTTKLAHRETNSHRNKTSSLTNNAVNRAANNAEFISLNGISSVSSLKKQWRYIIMHCTGYLKSITLKADECNDELYDCDSDNEVTDDEDDSRCKTVDCFVAVCRRSIMDRDLKPDRPLTFTCRYSMEGKFVFVDQRTTIALGYTPQQLLGTSHYAYCHKDSVNTFKECHRQCILKSEAVSSDIYQFKRANGQFLWLQTSLKSFRNPWTKIIDYIVANHTTAEGNPHYNEGCVPTKFNQDMTGEASQSQSSSPASSSSISLPESKKSSSPSSSSIESSYSMESYASGGSIRALLNQIDRIKSGGIKCSLNFHKKRSSSHAVRSNSGSSTRKSNEDSGNYSDLQSCSSVSSQNSGLSSKFVNNVTRGNDSSSPNSNQQQHSSSNSAKPGPYYNPKIDNSYREDQTICDNSANHQHQLNQVRVCQASNRSNVDDNGYSLVGSNQSGSREQAVSGTSNENNGGKGGLPRMVAIRVSKPMIGSIKPNQRPEYHYPYRHNQSTKSDVTNTSDSGHESSGSSSWRSSNSSVYPSPSTHHNHNNHHHQGHASGQQGSNASGGSCNVTDNQQTMLDKLAATASRAQTTYIMQPQMQATSMEVMQTRCYHTQRNSSAAYSMQPVVSYMTTTNENDCVDSRYATNDVNLEQMAAQMSAANEMQNNMSMTLNQQQQVSSMQAQTSHQSHSQGRVSSTNTVNVPMIWNPAQISYQDVNMIHNVEAQQISCQQQQLQQQSNNIDLTNMDLGNSNNQMIAQQIVHCPQCSHNKCCSNQSSMMMANQADLNSMNLTSLAVEGDLDEVELLECLAACESQDGSQMYAMQNNSYSQYNI